MSRHDPFYPSPERIAEESAKIRERHSEHEANKRRGIANEPPVELRDYTKTARRKQSTIDTSREDT